VTKLWNIARYALQSDQNFKLAEKISKKDLKTLTDRWIISELEETKALVGSLMGEREISLAQARLRRFTWDALADWYLEIHKLEKNNKILGYILHELLKLWHPFMPFVTEEIWDLFQGGQKLLMLAKWPKADRTLINKKKAGEFEELQKLIIKIRNIRASYHIDPAKKLTAYDEDMAEQEIIEKFGRIKIMIGKHTGKMLKVSSGKRKLYLDIAKSIDVKKELAGLDKEVKNLEKLATKTEALSQNKNFLNSAKPEVVAATLTRVDEYRQKLAGLKESEENLKSLL
jgi:valyl-tRNA synthetase